MAGGTDPSQGQVRSEQEPISTDTTEERTLAFSPERVEQVQELRKGVWQHQDRLFQYQQLEAQTRAFAERKYQDQPAALRRINEVLQHVFADMPSTKALFSVPKRIGDLLSHTPCIFTMLPGAGTHESLSQYDIVLVDRYSTVRSRSEVSVASHLTRDPESEMAAPILAANMRAVIGEDLAERMIAMGLTPVLHRFRRPLNPQDVDSSTPTVQSLEEANAEKIRWARKFGEKAYFSCGNRPEALDLAKQIIQEGAGGICVDVAIGNSEATAITVLELREFIRAGGYKTKIIAGNVDTAEGYFLLALAGADCVKVGIGPGSACTTRVLTRAGAGQGSALLDVGRAMFVFGENAPTFIADGGIEGSGDVLAALATQASSVMMGKLCAKTLESGALKKDINGKPHAWYFGEASSWARIYEQGGVKNGMGVEGRANWVPCSGSFEDLVKDITGGLRNALPYYNSRSIADLQERLSIPQQFCDLILGGTTGIHKSSPGTGMESGTRLQ